MKTYLSTADSSLLPNCMICPLRSRIDLMLCSFINPPRSEDIRFTVTFTSANCGAAVESSASSWSSSISLSGDELLLELLAGVKDATSSASLSLVPTQLLSRVALPFFLEDCRGCFFI